MISLISKFIPKQWLLYGAIFLAGAIALGLVYREGYSVGYNEKDLEHRKALADAEADAEAKRKVLQGKVAELEETVLVFRELQEIEIVEVRREILKTEFAPCPDTLAKYKRLRAEARRAAKAQADRRTSVDTE